MSLLGKLIHGVKNKVQQDVVNPIQRDVVHPVSHAVGNTVNAGARIGTGIVNQVNPIDNGRTFKQTQSLNNRSGLQQAIHNGLTNAAGSIVKPIPQFALDTGSLGYNKVIAPTFKLPQQNINKNPILGKTANFVGANGSVKQAIGSGIQTALTPIAPELKGASLLAKAGAGAGLGAAFGASSAFGEGANAKQIAKSAGLGAAFGAALPVAGKLAPVAGKAAAVGANKALDVAERKPFRNISDSQLSAASRVNNKLQGFPDNTKPGDVEAFRGVQKKLGVDVNNTDAVDQAILQRQAHGVKIQQRNQKLQSLPIGLGTAKVDSAATDVQPTKLVPPEAIVQPKQIESPAIPTNEVQKTALVNDTPKVSVNSLSKGAKSGRQNLSEETAQAVGMDHTVRNTNELSTAAINKADSQPLDKTISDAHQALSVGLGKIDDTTVANVQQAIERADASGRTEDAVALHDSLAEHLTKQGQTIQAASLLYRLSPQGQLYKAYRDLKKAGTEITPELDAKLRSNVDAIKSASDQATKERATAEFHKTVADNLPQKLGNNVLSVWKAGLLSGPLTQAGNLASNATFAGLHTASNPLATGIDKLISLKTGERTKTLTNKGLFSGAKQGVSTGIDTMKTGIDVRNIEGNKYDIHGEINFKNPVIQNVFGKTSNIVFRGMSAADQPFYYSALKNNLADLAKADGINKGLKGEELDKHITDTINNPTTEMAETAKLAAQTSVLGQDSKFASALSKFSQSHPALQAVIPFVKVPTNFLTRTVDFTPVGMGKGVYKAITDVRAGKSFDQRALSEALAEGVTGTGIITLGAMLANSSKLSGQYPTDPKEQQRWKSDGIQPNSVKLGGKWINLNYLGPVGLLFGAGKDYHDAVATGNNGAAGSAEGFGKNLAGQSFLTGFSGAANALNDPGRYGANFVHSQASSVVPAWVNAVGNATDSSQRQASSTTDAIKSKIPGVRNSLPVKTDVYGNALPQRANPIDITLDPLKPSNDLSQKNPVVSEVDRLHNADPNNSDLSVTPTPIGKSIKVDKQNVKLTARQAYDLQNQAGQLIQQKWGQLIQTPEYKSLDDAGKAKALSNLRTDTTTLAERDYVTSNNLASYTKGASTKVAALADGTGNVTDYTKSSSTSGSSTTKPDFSKSNDTEYNYTLQKYNVAKKAGTLTTAQNIQMQSNLAKAKVGSNYSQDTRQLYSLSKSQLYNYLTQSPNGKTEYDQLKSYDQALKDAGISTTLKFKNGLSTKTASSGTKRSSGGSRSTGKTLFRVSAIKAPKAGKIHAPKLKTASVKLKHNKVQSFKKVKITA